MFGLKNAAVVSKAVAELNGENPMPADGGSFRVVPLYDSMVQRFGRHFNFARQCAGDTATEGRQGSEMGVLALPSLERNSGPLFIAKIVRE